MDLSILGVTPQKKKQFFSKKIYTVEDLMRFLPRKYYDFRKPKLVKDLVVDEIEAIVGTVTEIKQYPKVLKVIVKDDMNWTIEMIFFNYGPYLLRKLDVNRKYIFYGKVTIPPGFFKKQIVSPKFSEDITKYQRIVPIYSDIKGMADDYLLDKIERGLVLTSKDEYLELEVLRDFGLIRQYEMERILHQPNTMDELNKAEDRLVFDELFKFGIITNYEYSKVDNSCNIKLSKFDKLNEFIKNLKFELTNGDDSQESTVFGILEEMKKGLRTSSLVQGDVGCGKTMVATLLMIVMAENGYQSALMAPTTVLAKQHFDGISKDLAPYGIKCAFLGGKMKAKEKRETLAAIKSGEINVIIGTHSVISKGVEFNNLGLSIVDEEHRFGVAQRRLLEKKASEGIHSITMSATPIPRSLAMTIYGDFVKVYTIKKMPKGRKPVITTIESESEKAYEFMYDEIKNGRQCYVVCPLIEESDSEKMEGIQSTQEAYEEMINYFKKYPEVRICQINGKMKQEEIDNILNSFAAHDFDIIISTTIIEVGVNVPNSTVILIKNAERFGLATLHQLRGRVGRGEYQSYCLLQSPKEEVERLKVMTETTDGFVISLKDLELRGMGDFIGTRQTGENKPVMLMLANPDLFDKIKDYTMDIVMDVERFKNYINIITDYNTIMGDEDD